MPAPRSKTGKAHAVPITAELRTILEGLPRFAGTDLVFVGRGRPTGRKAKTQALGHAVAMEGWNKRLIAARRVIGLSHWTPHDLRRTFRTGLANLGVADKVAELMLNHRPKNELHRAYDRAELWQERCNVAARWSRHVLGLLAEGGGVKVVPLARRTWA